MLPPAISFLRIRTSLCGPVHITGPKSSGEMQAQDCSLSSGVGKQFFCAECALAVFQSVGGKVKKKSCFEAARIFRAAMRAVGAARGKFIKRLQSICLAALLC
jgi:hypothetical protein